APLDRARARAEAVPAALIAHDVTGGEEPRQRNPDGVALEPEEGARVDQRTDGHGAPPQGREQIEDQAARARLHARILLRATFLCQWCNNRRGDRSAWVPAPCFFRLIDTGLPRYAARKGR